MLLLNCGLLTGHWKEEVKAVNVVLCIEPYWTVSVMFQNFEKKSVPADKCKLYCQRISLMYINVLTFVYYFGVEDSQVNKKVHPLLILSLMCQDIILVSGLRLGFKWTVATTGSFSVSAVLIWLNMTDMTLCCV